MPATASGNAVSPVPSPPPSAARGASRRGAQQSAQPGGVASRAGSDAVGTNGDEVDVATKRNMGANDSTMLAALVLGFAVAVGGVVVAAGRRGGHRPRRSGGR